MNMNSFPHRDEEVPISRASFFSVQEENSQAIQKAMKRGGLKVACTLTCVLASTSPLIFGRSSVTFTGN